jgi:UDP-glucose 4-epimerase
MKVLVTGGAGFIGSHICEELIAKGHDVVVVDNLSTGKEINLDPRVSFYELDIGDSGLSEVFEREKPELVCHQAAVTDVRKSVADPMNNAETNIMSMINLLENCRKYNVKKVVFASTGGALYGDTEQLPTTEDHPTMPISPYGINKLCGELYLRFYNRVHGLPVTILRYSNVYGPRQDRKGEGGVVAVFIRKAMLPDQDEVIINGDGEQTRDFAFVKDVAKANVMALLDAGKGLNIYNLGTGVETSVNKLFEVILNELGVEAKKTHGPTLAGEIRRSCLNNQKIKKELGWAPEYSLELGVKETIQYFRNNYNLI